MHTATPHCLAGSSLPLWKPYRELAGVSTLTLCTCLRDTTARQGRYDVLKRNIKRKKIQKRKREENSKIKKLPAPARPHANQRSGGVPTERELPMPILARLPLPRCPVYRYLPFFLTWLSSLKVLIAAKVRVIDSKVGGYVRREKKKSLLTILRVSEFSYVVIVLCCTKS